jgi:ubiquinone biosynthesis protein UbiJ
MSDLRWDLEEDLSRIVGDGRAPSHTGRVGTLGVAAEGGDQRGAIPSRYWTEERPVIAAAKRYMDRAVDDLRDDVTRLEQRIEHLFRTGPPRGEP